MIYKIIPHSESSLWTQWGLCFVYPDKEKKVFTEVYGNTSCRSYLQDAIWNFKNPEKAYSAYTVSKKITLFEDCTYIYGKSKYETLDNIQKRLSYLHKKEKEAGVSLTEILPAQDGVIFKGDKIWQSNLWKMSIYSFYLKKVLLGLKLKEEEDESYDGCLRKTEKTFLSKVATLFEEEVVSPNYDGVHLKSGFVTICGFDHYDIGYDGNPYMKKLILGE